MNFGFKGYHPLVNIIFFISTIVFGMLFKHPAYLLISFFASLIYYLRLSGREGRKTIFGFLVPMFFLVIIINSLFNHYGVTTLFVLPSGNNFTFEAVVGGTATGLAVVTVIQWFFCFNEVVTEDKFMHIFGRILPKGALVTSMILRFVPLYRKRYREISEARNGIRSKSQSGLVERIKFACKNMGILVSWSFENAIETADSMKARGYGLKGRTYYSRFRWTASDTVAAIALIIADIPIILGAANGATYCIYNPYVTINSPSPVGTTYIINELNLTLNPFTALSIAAIFAYLLLCFLPLIIDIKEDIRWNRLKSKI